ncbi:hypothetical protein WQE_51432 [Paraburkholderia hospita]|uniref:Insertion element IS402-like domain-containing protein n=1 Tax=Paraburkholderia hospita TaxID=169430 RepID=A0ABP2P5W7_9BURK|nr:hypothetical protein WQE_51432 [Paraburkholderia hospita]
MDKPIIEDEVWARIEPLLPPAKERRFRYPGRKPIPDRVALTGILFVLKARIRWRDLPVGMRCGSGVSCWRRMRDWQEAGVWDRLKTVLLEELCTAEEINFSRAKTDPSAARSGKSKKGAELAEDEQSACEHTAAETEDIRRGGRVPYAALG